MHSETELCHLVTGTCTLGVIDKRIAVHYQSAFAVATMGGKGFEGMTSLASRLSAIYLVLASIITA